MSESELALWDRVLYEELGHGWRNHIAHIAVTLECVTKGCKPAFLWDAGPSITADHVFNIVRILKTKELVSKDVHVIIIADDVFVVNLSTFRETMNEFVSRKRVFVDITGQEPKTIEPGSATDKKCREVSASISKSVALLGLDETERSECAVLPLEDDWCVPSLFGILSGYPFVYWYDTAVCDEPRCLDGITLQTYKLYAKAKCNAGEFRLYSFTVPSSVMDAAGGQGRVDRWCEPLTEKLRGHVWLSSLGVRGGTVEMSRVTL